MKAQVTHRLGKHPSGWWEVGEIIDHPDAYRLVRLGCALSADEECKLAVDMTPEQFQKAQATYPKVAAGLQPEDYSAWDRGWMRGYNPDGSWVPGPNYEEWQQIEAERRADEAGLYLP